MGGGKTRAKWEHISTKLTKPRTSKPLKMGTPNDPKPTLLEMGGKPHPISTKIGQN